MKTRKELFEEIEEFKQFFNTDFLLTVFLNYLSTDEINELIKDFKMDYDTDFEEIE